jgi:hypothetical protein
MMFCWAQLTKWAPRLKPRFASFKQLEVVVAAGILQLNN